MWKVTYAFSYGQCDENLQATAAAIILATHDMAEAEKMTDRVAILLRGTIVATGTPREITATGAGFTKVSVRTEQSILHQNNAEIPGVSHHTIDEEYAVYFSTDPGPTAMALIQHINNRGDTLIDLRVERPSLEERFLEITTAK